MGRTRWQIGLWAVAAAASAHAEPETWTFLLAGKKVGVGTYEQTGDRFTSSADVNLAGTLLAVTVAGRIEDGKLAELEVNGKRARTASAVTWKGGKMTATVDGKTQAKDVAFSIDADAFMGNFNPQLASSILTFAHRNPKASKLRIFIVDTFTTAEFTLKRRTGTAWHARSPIPTTILNLNVNGLDVHYAYEPGGRTIGMNVPAQMFAAVRDGYTDVFVDPVAKYPELSPSSLKVVTESKVWSAMRDGVQLACDIARPEPAGRYPVILVRTPYGRSNEMIRGDFWASRGYVLVAQDVRGRGESQGAWDPFNAEVADGGDTLDWLVRQPWCDGNVGMIGGSYLGMVQWSAASTGHPALKAIVPQVSPPDPTRNIPWDHGAFALAPCLWWSRVVQNKDADLEGAMAPLRKTEGFFKLPIGEIDQAMLGRDLPFWNQWVRRPTLADWPGAFRHDQIGKVDLPTLHVSGSWDGDGVGTKLHWEAGRGAGSRNEYMVFGPWEHGFNVKTRHADVEYGPQSLLELDSVYLRFFDAHLKGRSVFWERQPRVRFFVSGLNQWFTGDDWPFPYARPRSLFLAGPSAKGPKGKGELGAAPKGLDRDRFTYDPNQVRFQPADIDIEKANATTKLNDADMGRNDLAYTSAPFPADTVVTGPVTAELYVSTTARDATFHAMVADQSPSGETRMIGLPGTKRIWFELGRPGPIEPNRVYRIKVEPWEFAHCFRKGHRIVLFLTSDLFPQFARNPGTGEPDWKATRLVRATHSIHRSAKYPSRLTYFAFEP